MQNLRILACVVAAVGSVAVTGCGSSNDSGQLHIHNASSFGITEIQVTSVHSDSWGPNLVAPGDVLAPGETLVVDVSCGTYDARLIDESGAECRLDSVNVCLSTADWVIQDDQCPVFAAARAAREAAQATGSGSSAAQ